MRKFNLSLQWKFLLSITLIIFPTIGIIFMWEGMQHEKRAMDQIMNQARVLSRQIVLTRKWVSDCGGVMVDVKSEGARNTAPAFWTTGWKHPGDTISDSPLRWSQRNCPSIQIVKTFINFALQA